MFSGLTEYHVLLHFPNWREAVRAAGLAPDTSRLRISDEDLLRDWGEIVRKNREIPTRTQYQHQGRYSSAVFEKHFGPWSKVPSFFREFAKDKEEWMDILALMPAYPHPQQRNMNAPCHTDSEHSVLDTKPRHTKLEDRPTYGNPLDFRGLRHEPANEQGVVFLFGMVARELGYMVESVQTGFPDCEAKRQVGGGRWQTVKIEFEFESKNYDHPLDGCDVIVCWRHNWRECPPHIEVIELPSVIKTLSKSEG